DAEATRTWLAENKKGDIEFDPATRRLLPVRGATMATLDETEWYALDRIPTADLEKRVSDAPVESWTVPQFLEPNSPEARRGFRRLPTLIVETAEGKLALVRVLNSNGGEGTVNLQIRPRPLGPYLPFHRAEEGYDLLDNADFSPIETADALGDRFARTLKKQELPFVGPEQLAALRTELRDYLEARMTTPLYRPNRKALFKAVDSFVERNFSGPDCYLRFRDQFDALKWQLWTATEQKVGMTPPEHSALAEQRNWMHQYIFGLVDPQAAQRGLQVEPIKQLDSEVFGNPLSPFFADPMSAEEFEAFKNRVTSDLDLLSAPRRIFAAAVYARAAALKKLWPPGFDVHGVHVHGTQDFDFRGTSGGDVRWRSGPAPEGKLLLFDAASNDSVEQPAGLDEKASDAWLLENKKGDLRFDPATRRLIAVRGARLGVLAETNWYAIDRLSLADLRGRLAESPLDSYTLAELPGAGSPNPSTVEKVLRTLAEKSLRGLPTLVLETAEGKIVLLRIEQYDGGSVLLRCRARPLPPYPPFHPGDDAAAAPTPEAAKPVDAPPQEPGAASPGG
ncbi:MAG TPA: hypothetical protein VGG30_07135, partial [Pirellulales bacterium]